MGGNRKINETAVKNYVLQALNPLVDAPEELEVSVVVEGFDMMVNVQPAKSDIGKVVGRSGSIVKAITTLVNSAFSRGEYKTHVSIQDPQGTERKYNRDQGRQKGGRNYSSHRHSHSGKGSYSYSYSH